MMKMVKQNVLIQSWERARGRYHYPPLAQPKLVRGLEGGAAYDFAKRQTLVDEPFIDKLTKASGLSEQRCLEGVLLHEIGHYMVSPRTLGNFIFIRSEERRVGK